MVFSVHDVSFCPFQSTLPTRGSDHSLAVIAVILRLISIHAPHEGERPKHAAETQRARGYFNPRSPRGGATIQGIHLRWFAVDFNPRSPRGGATAKQSDKYNLRFISIHAPHEGERRSSNSLAVNARIHFNPRSPRGGATQAWAENTALTEISIHAPHEGERH